MNTDDLEIVAHCIICTEPIPALREERGSNTCSERCAQKRRRQKRAQDDARVCRYCKKPATLEERAAFERFRAIEASSPNLLYPKSFAQYEANGGTLEGFIDEIREFSLNSRDALRTEENPILIDMLDARQRMDRRRKKKEEKEEPTPAQWVCPCGYETGIHAMWLGHAVRCSQSQKTEAADGEQNQPEE